MSRVNIASLNINITASSQGLQQQVQQAVKAIKQLNTGVQQQNQGLAASAKEFEKILARSILLYGTFKGFGALKNQLFDSVKLAADAEKSRIAFEVLLGSAKEASVVIADLYKFVQTTPFSLVEVRDATQLLIGAGIESKKLMPTLRALGDVAAGSGKPFGELAFLYATARTEQRLYTKDLNQFLSANVPLIPVLARQFGVAEDSVRKLAEEGKISFDDLERAIASMTAAGGRFAGLTERQQQTVAGEYEKLLDTITQLKTEFGFGLNPTLRDFVFVLQELITAGDEGKSTLEGFNDAGVLLGETLRIVAATFAFIEASLISLEVGAIRLAKAFGAISDAVAGTNVNQFLDIMDEQLEKQAADLFAAAGRLADLSEKLINDARAASEESSKTLQEAIDGVNDATTRARNQLKFLTEDAKKFAAAIKESLLTPLELFRIEAKKLIEANLLGLLTDSELELAIAKEAEKLAAAAQKLKDVFEDGSGLQEGSKELEELLFKIRNQRKQEGADSPDVKNIIVQVRLEVEKELKALFDKLGGVFPISSDLAAQIVAGLSSGTSAGLGSAMAGALAELKTQIQNQLDPTRDLTMATIDLEAAVRDLEAAILNPQDMKTVYGLKNKRFALGPDLTLPNEPESGGFSISSIQGAIKAVQFGIDEWLRGTREAVDALSIDPETQAAAIAAKKAREAEAKAQEEAARVAKEDAKKLKTKQTIQDAERVLAERDARLRGSDSATEVDLAEEYNKALKRLQSTAKGSPEEAAAEKEFEALQDAYINSLLEDIPSKQPVSTAPTESEIEASPKQPEPVATDAESRIARIEAENEKSRQDFQEQNATVNEAIRKYGVDMNELTGRSFKPKDAAGALEGSSEFESQMEMLRQQFKGYDRLVEDGGEFALSDEQNARLAFNDVTKRLGLEGRSVEPGLVKQLMSELSNDGQQTSSTTDASAAAEKAKADQAAAAEAARAAAQQAAQSPPPAKLPSELLADRQQEETARREAEEQARLEPYLAPETRLPSELLQDTQQQAQTAADQAAAEAAVKRGQELITESLSVLGQYKKDKAFSARQVNEDGSVSKRMPILNPWDGTIPDQRVPRQDLPNSPMKSEWRQIERPQLLQDTQQEAQALRDAAQQARDRESAPSESTGRNGGNEKLSTTIETQAALDRAKLDRIAAAVEKTANTPTIVVQTFAA